MVRHWTAKALAEELSKLTIIIDSKEKVYDHIEKHLKSNNIPYKVRHLDTGDYSAMIGDMTLENDVVIERKANLDEICGNFTVERERFEREFLRAKANGIKVFLIIENASWAKVFLGDYRSELPVKSLVAAFLSWQVRYNLTIIFCEKNETPRLIHGILHYFAREVLIYGDLR